MFLVYKYALAVEDRQIIEIPVSWDIISAQEQSGNIVVYVYGHESALETGKQPMTREVEIIVAPTGRPFDLNGHQFLDTVKLSDGDLMFHIFYRYL